MKKKTSAPVQGGTATDLSADRALQLIGDDPATMLLVLELIARATANRARRGKKKSTHAY